MLINRVIRWTADKTVFDEIADGLDLVLLGKREMNSRAYVSRFNFSGGDQQKRVGQLSGGERNRVHLAKMLKSGANVLLLDEPTNDLDVNTMRALEEALGKFWRLRRCNFARPMVFGPHRDAYSGV